jgi:hypothetical protein
VCPQLAIELIASLQQRIGVKRRATAAAAAPVAINSTAAAGGSGGDGRKGKDLCAIGVVCKGAGSDRTPDIGRRT